MKNREEAWNKIETLAEKNPKFEELKQQLMKNNDYSLSFNPQIDYLASIDDDEDGDMTYEKLETEAKEVSQLLLLLIETFN